MDVTSSVNKPEIYSKLLVKENIKHVALNAKNHEREADIIANAGKQGSVIITTSLVLRFLRSCVSLCRADNSDLPFAPDHEL